MPADPLPPVLLAQIQVAVRTVRFGAIELTIHDGRIVQIETRAKMRVTTTADPTTDGGPLEHPASLHRTTGEDAMAQGRV